MMKANAEHRCDDHPDPFDCADNLIWYDPESGRYGLIIHDGGSSFIAIRYCPWCATELPHDPEDLE
ncbi:hypothetical protein KUA19_21820 [Catellatospora sp. NEAU-YM18]|nr:hypothetical protein [Catellatospora tritici]